MHTAACEPPLAAQQRQPCRGPSCGVWWHGALQGPHLRVQLDCELQVVDGIVEAGDEVDELCLRGTDAGPRKGWDQPNGTLNSGVGWGCRSTEAAPRWWRHGNRPPQTSPCTVPIVDVPHRVSMITGGTRNTGTVHVCKPGRGRGP